MIYLDSSALVTLVSQRRHVKALRGYLDAQPSMPMATSTIGFVETVRTLDSVGDFPNVLQELLDNYTEIVLTDEVRDMAAQLPSGVRTLDTLHIASAQLLGETLHCLVSYDKRMVQMAHQIGLPVASPGLD
ncbi:type II toxin-antitoxin system VapC family toxin [Spiractinospora alimapuensis]|uniref:type II toxin-antitoxin system VapC family toxin n=1 Tax=Spiractinospora alimapuensis TaxID=2820884 RepID=UPI001F191B30|nr:type II toxin-antitoxin system VapC family toxin [Spiractinospora alimapuensis]QVQ52600.1 type II toxin-antitoxin system VapC family toxin [Spiractinospora alimapuensis]